MARFSSGSSTRQGKRSRNVSENGSFSSMGSEVNVLSDIDEVNFDVPKKRRSESSGLGLDRDMFGKDCTSSDEESLQSSSMASTRGRKPKCFTRNAVLARQNRLKKKKYVEDLESELNDLRKENSKLKVSLSGYTKDVELVRKENIYLRNVLANSKEISQLIRSINVNCGLPAASTSLHHNAEGKRPPISERVPVQHPKVVVESAMPVVSSTNSDSCVPSSGPQTNLTSAARTVKKDFPIAVEDVSLSLSAPEDENEDDLDVLFGSKDTSSDLDFNLNEAPCGELGNLGFGPNAFGDWLDGDEPLANIGVCLHVANKKVSLEFCSSCNENAFCTWSDYVIS